MTPELHCEQDTLQKLLAEALSEVDEQAVSNHLAACPACREQFEVLAASGDWWREARQRLSHSADPTTRSINHLLDDDLQFSNDFAVDFLDACDSPGAIGRLGEYEIVEIIGRGGMGIVLKGFQRELHRHVAVKVLSPHLATSGAARRRFAREAQATAAVVNPHVMAIHAVNSTAKLPYLVMPFVPCESLQERLDRLGPLSLNDILRIGMQAARGLAAAHAQGLVHRDVKPANILLETNVDRVLLTDFGLARAVDDATLTRTGVIAGTPQYMSPEQANGDIVDHRSDLFSLGGVLYATCTGRPPFRAETTFGVLRRIRETPPRSIREINPDIHEWLERIVLRLLSKEQNDRFQTSEEVATLLEKCLAHVQQPTSVPLPTSVDGWPLVVPTESTDSTRHSVRRRWLLAVVAFAITVSVFALVMTWPDPQTASRPPQTNTDQQTNSVNSDQPLDKSTSIGRWNEVHEQLDSTEDLIQTLETTLEGEQ